MMDLFRDKFEINLELSNVKRVGNTYLATEFRNFKHRLHQHYKKSEGGERAHQHSTTTFHKRIGIRFAVTLRMLAFRCSIIKFI